MIGIKMYSNESVFLWIVDGACNHCLMANNIVAKKLYTSDMISFLFVLESLL